MSRKEILSRKIQIFRENQTILKYESTVQGKINFMITRAENLVRLNYPLPRIFMDCQQKTAELTKFLTNLKKLLKMF